MVYGPDFHAQVKAFRDLGEDRFERASLAWLSSYFALLAVSAKLVNLPQQEELGLDDADMSACASRW